MTKETLELLVNLLNNQQLAVGSPDFLEAAPRVCAAKIELEAALRALEPPLHAV